MIWHRSTKFHPNENTHGKVMTSYRFTKNLKNAARWRRKLPTAMFFTALRGMQTRSSDENYVCPSVCLSHAWIVTKRKTVVKKL